MKTNILPHSTEAEAGLLACCLLQPEKLGELIRLPVESFHDLRHANLFKVMREMFEAREVIDPVTLVVRLKDKRLLNQVGGMTYLHELPEQTPSPENLSYYLGIVKEKHALRKLLAVCQESEQRILNNGANPEDILLGVQADLETVSRLGSKRKTRPILEVHTGGSVASYIINPALRLIGDNEICKGYDGVCLIAGPGGAGKSLIGLTLALAGARGDGLWQGRKVHRKFKTLIIQAENGMVRLKNEFEALKKNHPELDLDNYIFISSPPEGGLPFHRGEFRAAVRDEIAKYQPDLIEIDPWAQVAVDDSAKDVVDKLSEIRSCFPGGDDCPGLVIVAHTKKPRAEDVRRGRALLHQVSGSIALVNTARCVYMLLPWTDDPEDPRCYWCCAKLNNGEMYPASVWFRRFGTFFDHDANTNPKDWGRSEDEDARRAVTEDQLRDSFGKETELFARQLIQRVTKLSGCSETTAYRAIGEDGYLRGLLRRTATGKLSLKEA